jgi:predicted transcriptional regulator
MGTTPMPDNDTHAAHVESAAEMQRRLDWEAEGIAKARASIAAGRVVDSAKMKAWIDSIGTDHELPVPCSGR